MAWKSSLYNTQGANIPRVVWSLYSSWDFKTNLDSEAMSIAHFYGTRLLREIKRPNGYSELEHLTFWGSSESDPKKKLALLSATVEPMTADFGTRLSAWGEVNRYQRIDGSIYKAFSDSLPSIAIPHASGRWGALAAYGARYHNNTKKIYGTRGNSFVAVVEFGDKVEAYSLLAGGQSGDPSSKHFDDQTSLYVDGAFKKVPFYKEEVLRRAIETYHPGERY